VFKNSFPFRVVFKSISLLILTLFSSLSSASALKGLEVHEIGPELARELNVDRFDYPRIRAIETGSRASTTRLEAGDVVLSVDGAFMNASQFRQSLIESDWEGDRELTINRGGFQGNITLSADTVRQPEPSAFTGPDQGGDLGLITTSNGAWFDQFYPGDTADKARILLIASGSPSAVHRERLTQHIVLTVDDIEVDHNDFERYVQQTAPGSEITIKTVGFQQEDTQETTLVVQDRDDIIQIVDRHNRGVARMNTLGLFASASLYTEEGYLGSDSGGTAPTGVNLRGTAMFGFAERPAYFEPNTHKHGFALVFHSDLPFLSNFDEDRSSLTEISVQAGYHYGKNTRWSVFGVTGPTYATFTPPEGLGSGDDDIAIGLEVGAVFAVDGSTGGDRIEVSFRNDKANDVIDQTSLLVSYASGPFYFGSRFFLNNDIDRGVQLQLGTNFP